MKQLAWVGVGVMGAPMAGHLVAHGHSVRAYSRRPEALAPLVAQHGFVSCSTIAEAVSDAEVVFVMVGYPNDVEQVFLGTEGIFEHLRPGSLAVDMTTSSPALAQRLHAEGKKRGIGVIDAPVSGGDNGAKNATLSIMVGADEADFLKVLPLLECMGKAIHHMGPAGSGQHTKACNQICVAGATAAYTEAIAYAQRVGLDPAAMLSAIGGGAAGSWQINNMAPRALRGDLAPGFYIKHFVKDMRIIKQECEAKGLELEMLDSVLALYETMMTQGHGDLGTQALISYYAR